MSYLIKTTDGKEFRGTTTDKEKIELSIDLGELHGVTGDFTVHFEDGTSVVVRDNDDDCDLFLRW